MLTLYIADVERDAGMKNLSQKEAIVLLRNLEDSLDSYCGLNEEGKTAFRMAIEALSCSEIPNSSDTISRQHAIDALRKMQTYKLFAGDDLLLIDQTGAQTELMMLPSAQPEKSTENTRKTHGVCLDTISRQQAIDALDKRFDNVPMEQTAEILGLRKDLRELPSAQPDIIRCKDCAYCDSDVVDSPYGMTNKV